MSEPEITDLDAFLPPSPRRLVKIQGATYGVLDLFDLSRNELNVLATFEKRTGSMSQDEQYAELKSHVKRLVPKIEDAVLDDMPLRKLGALFHFVQRVAKPESADPLAQRPDA